MSEIAKALASAAKITESKHLQRAHQKSAEAIRKNHNREFLWSGLLACVGVVILAAYLVHSSATAPAIPTPPATNALPLTPPPQESVPIRPNPVLESELANLVIKGSMKSPTLRVLIGDKVIEVGDELIPGLVLSGIDGRDLIAADTHGVKYVKKM